MGLLHRLTEIVKEGEALATRALESPFPPLRSRERWGEGGGTAWLGDNLEGLSRCLRGELVPGQASLEGAIDLVSIDPPYFRNIQARQHHGDPLTESVIESRAWHDGGKGGPEGHLTRLYARLVLLHRLLSPRGSLYLQTDRILAPWLRVLLDELFGPENFVNEITWKRANAHNDARRFGSVSDAILFYGKGPERIWNPVHRSPAEREDDPHWSRDPEGRLFRKVPVDAPRRGKAAARLYAWKGRLPAPGRAWSMPHEAMEALEREGRLVETSSGTPCRLVYADELEGPAVQDLWEDIPAVSPRSRERLDYPTQKPEALVERLLLASSLPGSRVLDAYAGSGTLGAVALRHGRIPLLMDSSPAAALIQRKRLGNLGLELLCSATQTPSRVVPTVLRPGDEAGTSRIEVAACAPGHVPEETESFALVEGWAIGHLDADGFRPLRSCWRDRHMGRRLDLTDSVTMRDLPEGAAALRLWDIEGGQADLLLGGCGSP